MKVLLTGTSFHPNYGGPAVSVSRLAIALAEAGADVGLWAPDQSVSSTSLLPPACRVRRIVDKGVNSLMRHGKIDVLHDNGLWLVHNHQLAQFASRQGIPRLVSTRGMLEPWALRHKRLKKKAAWWLYQLRDLRRAGCLHATSETEAINLRRLGLGVPIVTVPNGVDVPSLEWRERINSKVGNDTRARKIALFMGRIHPVKGLPMLVEAWARVRPQGWLLRIAGPDEAGQQRKVEEAVSDAGLSDVVSFVGPIDFRSKAPAFCDADLVVLPTLSESFGMVVLEALAHGVPVLTTTAAPWSSLLENECGWWVDPTVDGIAEGLRKATALDVEMLRRMGARGRELAVAKFSWKHAADLVLSAYELILRT